MELFALKPTVIQMESLSDFAKEFALGKEDMIFCGGHIYESEIKPLGLSCQVINKSDYSNAEPDDKCVDAILSDMKGKRIKRIIAIGGGSVIDIAKVICVKNAYPIARVMNREIPLEYDKELIIIPTTCGTGSEVTYGGIITMSDTGLKSAIIDPALSAKYAVLIPSLLYRLSNETFFYTSIDALSHAMESFVSATRGNELDRAVGMRAIRLLMEGYVALAERGFEAKLDLCESFSYAACLGGMAVNNGGAGPVHALAYPLGEIYKVGHGEGIYQFLTNVFKHYEKNGGAILSELEETIGSYLERAGIINDSVFAGLDELLNRILPKKSLSYYGLKEEECEIFAKRLFDTKQRLLAASYTDFTVEDAQEIYENRL